MLGDLMESHEGGGISGSQGRHPKYNSRGREGMKGEVQGLNSALG
jgi:hypothetical protein